MGNRHSSIRATEIEYTLNLVFDDKGGCRMTRGPGGLAMNERAVALTVSLPRALFRTPSLSAKLTIDAPDQPPPTIDLHAVEAAVRGVIGADVRISVEGNE